MITLDEDSEFTLLFKDFIETLVGTEKFLLKIWVSGSEIPYQYDETFNYHFIQEGFRVMNGVYIDYHFYDTITGIRVIY